MCNEKEQTSANNGCPQGEQGVHGDNRSATQSDSIENNLCDIVRVDGDTLKVCSAGSFFFTCPEWSGVEIPVFYSVPEHWRRCDPIIICMHGVQRNAQGYLRNCSQLALQHGGQSVALICPEFSRNNFPTNLEYNQGNMIDQKSAKSDNDSEYQFNPVRSWSFFAIEKIFEKFQTLSGSTANGYYLYGHSAGAQFVHRFMAMKSILDSEGQGVRVIKCFAANSGFWTFPTMEYNFPYGLGRLPYTDDDLKCFLSSPLHILLGELDVDENHEHLNRSDGAMLQGRHRLERGQAFHQAGVEAALRCGVKLGWTVETVEGAGHSNRAMFTSVLTAIAAASSHSSCCGTAPNHADPAASRSGWHPWQDVRHSARHTGKARGHDRRSEHADAHLPSSHRRNSKDCHGPARSALAPLATHNAGQPRQPHGVV